MEIPAGQASLLFFYRCRSLESHTAPIKPITIPKKEQRYATRLRKNVEGMTCITISKGRMTPRRSIPKAMITIILGLTCGIIYLYNQQATLCSGLISKSGGTSTSHRPAIFLGQRGWKRQPGGGVIRLGGSPVGISL